MYENYMDEYEGGDSYCDSFDSFDDYNGTLERTSAIPAIQAEQGRAAERRQRGGRILQGAQTFQAAVNRKAELANRTPEQICYDMLVNNPDAVARIKS